MTGRYGTIDYVRFAKRGFLLGFAVFALGAGAELVGHAAFGSLPAWGNTLSTDMEYVGLAVLFLSPLVFGLVLPLTE